MSADPTFTLCKLLPCKSFIFVSIELMLGAVCFRDEHLEHFFVIRVTLRGYTRSNQIFVEQYECVLDQIQNMCYW